MPAISASFRIRKKGWLMRNRIYGRKEKNIKPQNQKVFLFLRAGWGPTLYMSSSSTCTQEWSIEVTNQITTQKMLKTTKWKCQMRRGKAYLEKPEPCFMSGVWRAGMYCQHQQSESTGPRRLALDLGPLCTSWVGVDKLEYICQEWRRQYLHHEMTLISE